MLRVKRAVCAGVLIVAGVGPGSSSRAAVATNILFVGNSFTYGNVDPAATFNASAITDADGTGYGGVPGIFKKMTDQAGLNYAVTIEAVPSIGLDWHYANKSSVIGMSKWNDIVLQEYSTRPTPSDKGGDIPTFLSALSNIQNLVRSNSNAQISLYETWARPDQVFPSGSAYQGQGLQKMQTDLHNNYILAYARYGLTTVSLVGEAFMRAIREGVANPDPYNANPAGTINLWYDDDYHASNYGSYLAGAVFFRSLTGFDPRTLPTGTGSAAAGLSVSPADAARLETIAYESVPNPPPVVDGKIGSIDPRGSQNRGGQPDDVPEPAGLAVSAIAVACVGRRRRA